MKKVVRKYCLIFSVLWLWNIKSGDAVEIALLDNLEAPLKANLDISPLTKQLKTLIENEVERKLQAFVDKGMERIDKTVKMAESTFQSKLNDTLHLLQNRKKAVGPAFTATLSRGQFKSLAKGEILKFDKVYLDRGGGYNSITGYYTTPKSGVYLVSCTVRPYGTNLHVWLWKDKERLVLAYGGGWNTGSLTVVLDLQQGNRLYIKHDGNGKEKIQTINTSMFSVTFLSD